MLHLRDKSKLITNIKAIYLCLVQPYFSSKCLIIGHIILSYQLASKTLSG